MLPSAQKPWNSSFHLTQACSSSLFRIHPSLIVIRLFCHKAFAACIALLPGFTRPRYNAKAALGEEVSTQTQECSDNQRHVKVGRWNCHHRTQSTLSATMGKDYQRSDRNMRETHLQSFSDFLQKLRSKRERDSQTQCPHQPRKQGSWTLLQAWRVVPVTGMGQVSRNISHL